MEKYGVACGCASGNVKLGEFVKQADGSLKCPHCGGELTQLKLNDKVTLKDRSDGTVKAK